MSADEHHTLEELYEYRSAYNSLLFNEWAKQDKYDTHKSWRHNDGELCFGGGWFIVTAQTSYGQVTNHYPSSDWKYFHIPEKRIAAPYDGHTPEIALKRLQQLAQNKG